MFCSPFKKYLGSSIVKKQMMAITGLMLCGFLITHLIGNCLIYAGPEAFNAYAHGLTHNKKFLYSAEAVLFLLFMSHIVMAIKLTIENKLARPTKYYMKQATGRGATFASATMPYTGLITLIFLVFHLLHFRFGADYYATYNGQEMRDVYRLLIEYFSSPLSVIWYIFCVLALALHVSHGFHSAFQSLGFNHPKYNDIIKLIAKVYAVIIAIGFSALPIYCYMQGGL